MAQLFWIRWYRLFRCWWAVQTGSFQAGWLSVPVSTMEAIP